MRPQISPMLLNDAPDVAQLASQLGYPVKPEEVVANFQFIRDNSSQEVFVARTEIMGPAIGWLHAFVHFSVATGPRCEIGGVVVDESFRGRGVGTQLMLAAEAWAKSKNLAGIRFSSRTSRTDAHRLYERLGYQIQKTSHVFGKQLLS